MNSFMRLFADDCVMYCTINSLEGTEAIQSNLNTIEMGRHVANAIQCQEMHSNDIKSSIISNCAMKETILETVCDYPYLRVTIADNLLCTPHINNLTKKANSALGFVRRNLSSTSKNTKKQAYTSLVHPHLENATSAWDPYRKKTHRTT